MSNVFYLVGTLCLCVCVWVPTAYLFKLFRYPEFLRKSSKLSLELKKNDQTSSNLPKPFSGSIQKE